MQIFEKFGKDVAPLFRYRPVSLLMHLRVRARVYPW